MTDLEALKALRHRAEVAEAAAGLMAEQRDAMRARLAKVAPAIIRGAFDLSSETLARMIWRLYRAGAETWVPRHDLELEIESVGMTNENTVRVYVGRIRKAMDDPEFIVTEPRVGYRLSTEARARVASIMGD